MFLSVIEVGFNCITYTVDVASVCGLYMYVRSTLIIWSWAGTLAVLNYEVHAVNFELFLIQYKVQNQTESSVLLFPAEF